MRNAVLYLLVLILLMSFGRGYAEVELADYLYGRSRVNAILEAGDYVYTGTDIGLFRVNRTDFTTEVFHIANSGLQAKSVLCLGSRSDGSIWIGTSSGLFRMVGDVISHVQSNLEVHTLHVDSQERVWFSMGEPYSGTSASSTGMISATDEFVHLTNLPAPNSIYCDNNNRLYLGYDNGIEVRLVGGTGPGIYYYNTGNTPLPDNHILDIEADDSGAIWISTTYGLSRFYQYNWTVWSQQNFYAMLANASQISIHGDDIWLTNQHGLIFFDGNEYELFTGATFGYTDVPITSVYAGSRIWFGLNGYLLSRTESSFVNTRLYNTDLKSNHLSSCYIDPWDNAWLSYYESPWISKITNTEVVHIPAPDDGPYDYNLCGNSARGLYLSTQAGGIFHRVDDNWHNVPVQLSYSSLEGTPWQDKILYTSRSLGIIVVDNETVSYINTTTPENSINNSYYITVDPQNRIWFDNRALFSIENGEITQHPPFIDNLMTRCMAAAPDGSIWIGVLTSAYDLVRYDPQSQEYTTFTLPGDDFGAHQLCFDPFGYLWIIGDNNVYTYSPDQGFSTVLSYLNHDYDLVDLNVDNDGRVWLLTEQAVFIFTSNPSATTDPVATPPALITSLRCYPNPFKGSLNVSLDLREASPSKLEVFNLRGQLVRTVFSGPAAKGLKSFNWDGIDDSGIHCATGIYIVKAGAGSQSLSQKILIP